jgi:hypothetical protein
MIQMSPENYYGLLSKVSTESLVYSVLRNGIVESRSEGRAERRVIDILCERSVATPNIIHASLGHKNSLNHRLLPTKSEILSWTTSDARRLGSPFNYILVTDIKTMFLRFFAAAKITRQLLNPFNSVPSCFARDYPYVWEPMPTGAAIPGTRYDSVSAAA